MLCIKMLKKIICGDLNMTGKHYVDTEDEVDDFLGSITFKAWLAYNTDGDNDIVYDERNN